MTLLLVCGFPAQADEVYVSDSGNGTINRFDPAGNGSVFASGLNSPSGLAFDNSGNLFVADSGSGTIEKFNSSGNGTTFASGLNGPAGLAFDSSGDLFVANTGNGTIEKFNSLGNGSVFASGLSFGSAAYLAFDSSGNLYASTTRTIEKFDSEGNDTTLFSTLAYVYGLAFDGTGNLFVSMQNIGSIWGINGGGVNFGNPFTAGPAGIAFDSDNNFYVTLGGSVEKYSSFGGTIQVASEANSTVFASGLDGAEYIVVQAVPEPSTWAMIVMSAVVWLASFHIRGRLYRVKPSPNDR